MSIDIAIAMVAGAVILAIGFIAGFHYGTRAERNKLPQPGIVPPLSPDEMEQIASESQRKLAEAFTPGISHRFRGPSFGRPRLVIFHESDYEEPMMCAVGPKDTHRLTSGQKVYEIPVDTHDGQEGNVLLVCWIHGRPDEALS